MGRSPTIASPAAMPRQHGKASRDPWHLDAIALAEDQVGDLKISLRGAQPHTSIQQ